MKHVTALKGFMRVPNGQPTLFTSTKEECLDAVVGLAQYRGADGGPADHATLIVNGAAWAGPNVDTRYNQKNMCYAIGCWNPNPMPGTFEERRADPAKFGQIPVDIFRTGGWFTTGPESILAKGGYG